jgi:hypothetical protein
MLPIAVMVETTPWQHWHNIAWLLQLVYFPVNWLMNFLQIAKTAQ